MTKSLFASAILINSLWGLVLSTFAAGFLEALAIASTSAVITGGFLLANTWLQSRLEHKVTHLEELAEENARILREQKQNISKRASDRPRRFSPT